MGRNQRVMTVRRLPRTIRVRRVQHARVADDQVARADRDVHLVGILLQRRMALPGGVERVAVGGRQGVQPMPPAMGAGDHPQAAVVAVGVDQVVHQKYLHRLVGIAGRIVPQDPVLVPVQRRRHPRRFADDEAAVEPGSRIAHAGQHRARRRQHDQRQHLLMPLDLDHRAGEGVALLLLCGEAVGGGVGKCAHPLDQVARHHAGDVAVAVFDQPPLQLGAARAGRTDGSYRPETVAWRRRFRPCRSCRRRANPAGS